MKNTNRRHYNISVPNFSGSTKPLNLIANVQKLQTRFSMIMKFLEPKLHIGSIVKYQLECIRDNTESLWQSTTDNRTEITATNLIPFSVYRCKVSPLNQIIVCYWKNRKEENCFSYKL